MNKQSFILGDNRPDLIREETLCDLFQATALNFPEKTALIFHDQHLSYRELDRWSDKIASFLKRESIGQGSFVGIWWQRGFELHAAILGVIKAGATYVPVDREIPAERVEIVLKEVGAAACFSVQELNTESRILSIPAQPEATDLIKKELNCLPGAYAYVLYTSGSTGKPKGIPIGHRQICHFVRAEQSILNIRSDDRVYQGFSVSFDMWCEETWISYFVGATLYLADNTMSKSIDELGEVLKNARITVLHAVPSLLAVMDNDIPSLRLLNAGGEACTPQVLEKWSRSDIEFFNSYGPTETTVSATIAELKAGNPIVIGRPLPNYNVAVVNDALEMVEVGESGELVISGPGVSSGYIHLPSLTHEKFISSPASLKILPGAIVYRTGDAAIMNENGGIQLFGRLDDQIKLRGYRIELGEIELKLNEISGVATAAVAVKKDGNGQDQLVGYVVTEGLSCIDQTLFRIELSKTLPSYMVPGTIVLIDEMPRMPSGKINRKALPVPEELMQHTPDTAGQTLDLNAPVSDRVLAVLHQTFPGREIDFSMDFFNELGGHSLIAAGFVSKLRRDGGMPYISLKDVYIHRPLHKLLDEWDKEQQTARVSEKSFNVVPWYRYALCWAAQTVSLFIIYGLFAFQIFIPYLGYYYVDQKSDHALYSILTSLALFCLIPPIFTLLSIASKWILIGKFKAGDYPLWGSYYFKWWFVKTMQRLVPVQVLNGTPLYPLYLHALGMKIAPNAQLSDFNFGAPDLISIGEDVSISSKVSLDNAIVENGLLRIGTIDLAEHAYIGSSAVLSINSKVEAWGELKDLSNLQKGKVIGEREVWQGSPATIKERKQADELPQPLYVSDLKRRGYMLLFSLSILVFPIIILLPLLPTIITINRLDNDTVKDYDFSYLVQAPWLALVYLMLFGLETIVLTRFLQRDLKPGKYPVYSLPYVRKWFADQLMSLSLIVLHPIYATVYVSAFFRLLGAKVGKDAEISTASSVTHPLLEIGECAFVADAVTLGEADVRGQQLILALTVIDKNSFVGNSALIPQGYHLHENMLIGVLSTPPEKTDQQASQAGDWFGSPAIALPRRQQSNPFPAKLTFQPSLGRKIARALVEFIRIILPESAVICFSIYFIAYGHALIVDEPFWKTFVLFPLYYLLFMGLPAFFLTVLLKWVLVGKYKAKQEPMWTWHVWISEAITSTYEALSVPFLLDFLQGTPWLPLLLRLLGVKMGKRVWMNTTDLTEFDMVSIGDDAALNTDCGPQTHLFEDRVMKVGPVKIGCRSTIGSGSIILYDSELGDDTSLEALSLVMKGERLAPGTDWTGSPVKPLD